MLVAYRGAKQDIPRVCSVNRGCSIIQLLCATVYVAHYVHNLLFVVGGGVAKNLLLSYTD